MYAKARTLGGTYLHDIEVLIQANIAANEKVEEICLEWEASRPKMLPDWKVTTQAELAQARDELSHSRDLLGRLKGGQP